MVANISFVSFADIFLLENAIRYLMVSLRRFFTLPLTKMSDRWKGKKKLHLAARSAYLSYKIGKEDPERLLQIAALEMKAEKYNLTIRYLEDYLELNPGSKKALLLLGIAYRRNKDYEKAIEIHLECLKKGEEESDILYTLGIDYERAGKIRTTKRYYAKCIETDSSFAKAYFRLARLYMRDKKYDLAVNLYLDGLSLREGSAKDWINLSFCYINTSNLVAAEKVLLEALENFPDSSGVLFALGAYYIRKQKYNKIPEIISKLDSEEDWYIVLSLQLKERLDKKEYEELEKLLEQIKKEDRNAEYWYMDAIVSSNKNESKKAIQSLNKAVKLDPKLRKEAKKDENFAAIRKLEEFKHIVYPKK